MTTREQTKEILMLLSALPNNPITSYDLTTPEGTKALEIFVNTYHRILEDIPIEFAQAAAAQYLSENNKFFPSNPGILRDIAFDLEMMARDIPAPAMAWAMVLSAKRKSAIYRCEEAEKIANQLAKIEQPGIIKTPEVCETVTSLQKEYFEHSQKCSLCVLSDNTETEYEYEHETVSRVVYLMGGRDAIFTDNLTADRARFLESYRDLVALERRKLQIIPDVEKLVTSKARPLIGNPAQGMKLLADKMKGN